METGKLNSPRDAYSMDSGDHEAFPAYAYVPKGPWPHPTRSLQGHSAGRLPRPLVSVSPISPEAWDRSPAYLRGFRLFNAGYYWEAHEVWEELWHAHGRKGETADLLRGLIKLAAAGVKVRERQPRGVATHAQRAAALFRSVQDRGGPSQLGLHLGELARLAQQIADDPPNDSSSPEDRVARVFAFNLEPRPCDPPEEARGP